MERWHINLSSFQRTLPHPLPVHSLGFIPHKAHSSDFRIGYLSFFFILNNNGQYLVNDQRYPIEAPCLFICYPGAYVRYGPLREWSELFICYSSRLLRNFKRQGLARSERLVWPINNPVRFQAAYHQLFTLYPEAHELGGADRIDRACEALIAEAILGSLSRHIPDKNELVVHAIRTHIENHFLEKLDYAGLAREHGLSTPHFRRLWRRYFNLAPARYVMHLKMQEACRLLVETRLRIGEISYRLHFENPLYFSACFRQWIGHTATEYRALYQKRLK